LGEKTDIGEEGRTGIEKTRRRCKREGDDGKEKEKIEKRRRRCKREGDDGKEKEK